MKTAIGIDVGGTNVRCGLVDERGAVLARRSAPVGDDRTHRAVIDLTAQLVAQLVAEAKEQPTALGCGVPGIVDSDRGVVIRSPNFPDWEEVAIGAELTRVTGLAAVVDNDANQYALGEQRCGAGRGRSNLILLTLGTGIGGGIVLDGKILHGDCGFAGEVGHMVVEADGVDPGIGWPGDWEHYAASRGFATLAARLPEGPREAFVKRAGCAIDALTPERVAQLADAGNAQAVALWQEFGRYLGVGMASLINIFGVTTFVLGGGIARSWDRFVPAAREAIARHTYQQNVDRLVIEPAALGDDAGIIGSALEALDGS